MQTPPKPPSTGTEDRLKIAIGVLLALVLAVGAALLVTRGGDDATQATPIDSTTLSSTTTSTTEVTGTTFAPGTTTSSLAEETTTSTTSTTTTTTTAPPEPTTTVADDERQCTQINALTANGLSGELCREGAAVAGSPTRFHLTASDGDARVRDDCGSPVFSWGEGDDTVVCAIGCSPESGPTQPSSIDLLRDHTFEEPGFYDVTVQVESNCGEGITGERQTFELRVDIRGD